MKSGEVFQVDSKFVNGRTVSNKCSKRPRPVNKMADDCGGVMIYFNYVSLKITKTLLKSISLGRSLESLGEHLTTRFDTVEANARRLGYTDKILVASGDG